MKTKPPAPDQSRQPRDQRAISRAGAVAALLLLALCPPARAVPGTDTVITKTGGTAIAAPAAKKTPPPGKKAATDRWALPGRAPDLIKEYKQAGSFTLNAHIFNPPGHKPTDRAPAIAFFFGGGWVCGTPKQFYQQSRYVVERGMVAISFEYRARKSTTPFDSVSDAKSAIRWMRANATELGIDPDRIVAAGGSAGGHIAACTGVIKGCEEETDDLAISSLPNAMVLYNPVIDTTKKGYGAHKVKGRETEISPCHHVTTGVVPTLVMHGTADKTVPFENAERFTRLMTEAGNVCKLVPFENDGHGFFNGRWFRPGNSAVIFNRTMQETVNFLQEQGILEPKPGS